MNTPKPGTLLYLYDYDTQDITMRYFVRVNNQHSWLLKDPDGTQVETYKYKHYRLTLEDAKKDKADHYQQIINELEKNIDTNEKLLSVYRNRLKALTS